MPIAKKKSTKRAVDKRPSKKSNRSLKDLSAARKVLGGKKPIAPCY